MKGVVMILTHKQIHEGTALPGSYGVAWQDFTTDTITCYLWPFNVVFALVGKYWQKVRYYRVENPLEIAAMKALSKRKAQIREKGYKQGFADGAQARLNKLYELKQARLAGARDMMNEFCKKTGLDPMPDDWNPYKDN